MAWRGGTDLRSTPLALWNKQIKWHPLIPLSPRAPQLEARYGVEEMLPHKPQLRDLIMRIMEEITGAAEEEEEAPAAPAASAAPFTVKPEAGVLKMAPPSSDDESNSDSSSSDSSDSSDEEGQEEKKVGTKGRAVKKEAVKKEGKEPKKGGGFNKEQAWSEQMTAFLGGTGYMSRPQVTKRLWEYIKAKDLQKPGDRRVILCDTTLQGLFGVESINMFKMAKAVEKHIRHNDRETVADEEEDEEEDGEDSDDEGDSQNKKRKASPKKKKAAAAKKEAAGSKKRKKESVNSDGTPKKKSGFPPERISPELQQVVGKATASRNEVVKALWDYIKANNMQDPSVGNTWVGWVND